MHRRDLIEALNVAIGAQRAYERGTLGRTIDGTMVSIWVAVREALEKDEDVTIVRYRSCVPLDLRAQSGE
jgi:hypothetical protein